MGYSFRLAARVILYAHTYHGLCYTNRGTLTGRRNCSRGVDPTIHRTIIGRSTTELHLASIFYYLFIFIFIIIIIFFYFFGWGDILQLVQHQSSEKRFSLVTLDNSIYINNQCPRYYQSDLALLDLVAGCCRR